MAELGEHPRWLDPLLAAGEILFGTAIQLRARAYDRGLLRVGKAGVPVISVGNLRVGGSGKTPFTILLAERLLARGRRPAVVTRGYGRRSDEAPLLVSSGAGPLIDVERSGDEPRLLALRTRAVVVVDPDRLRGAAHAVAQGADLILLDDGFQHRKLGRDLDLVLLDAEQPFGNGHLLPRGPLRERREALGRAHVLVSVHPYGVLPTPGPVEGTDCAVQVQVEPLGLGPELLPIASLSGKPVGLLSAIARPERFRRMLEAMGAQVVYSEAHSDHAFLTANERAGFVARARASGAEMLLTTEKDAVRFGDAPELLSVAIRHHIVAGEAALDAALDRALGAVP